MSALDVATRCLWESRKRLSWPIQSLMRLDLPRHTTVTPPSQEHDGPLDQWHTPSELRLPSICYSLPTTYKVRATHARLDSDDMHSREKGDPVCEGIVVAVAVSLPLAEGVSDIDGEVVGEVVEEIVDVVELAAVQLIDLEEVSETDPEPVMLMNAAAYARTQATLKTIKCPGSSSWSLEESDHGWKAHGDGTGPVLVAQLTCGL